MSNGNDGTKDPAEATTPTDEQQIAEIFEIHIYPYAHNKLVRLDMEGAAQLLANLLTEAKVEELRFGLAQLSGLDKSHIGRSFYTRNTAFKNYAVKFWNNRMKDKRTKILDRIKSLQGENE